MAELLCLRVWTPGETILETEDVRWVQAQLADGGGIGIRPGHAPLLAETVTAPLRYADGEGEHILDLEAGILQIELGSVTVYTSGRARGARSQEAPEGAHFDRLARALLAALKAQPERVLDADDGKETQG